ncbi:hypothetical protein OAO55_01670 [Bacteroidales bacterium]|nr:hypothetical protein [Bacteroidales bacterium]
MKKVIKLALIFGLTFGTFYACNDTDDAEVAASKEERVITEIQMAEVSVQDLQEELISEEILNDVLIDILGDLSLKSGSIDSCPIRTVEKLSENRFPRKITRDFGEGCEHFGKLKTGKIITTLNAPYYEEKAVHKVEFEAYTINGIAIDGHKQIQYLGTNEDEQPQFRIMSNIFLIRPNGIEVHRVEHKERILIAGFDTKNDASDNENMITGSSSVTKSNGVHYKMEIIEPMHWANSCKWALAGVKEIKIFKTEKDLKADNGAEKSGSKNYVSLTLDFGDGNCDNILTYMIEGEEAIEVELK